MATEIEEKFNELSTSKAVRGVLILNQEGAPIKTNLDARETEAYAIALSSILRAVRKGLLDLDSGNDLTFARLRTKKYEILLAPDKQYVLVVIHHPQE